MRKLLISLLLASAAAATPALAQSDNPDRQQARAERQQARSDRQQARDSARAERPAPEARPERFTPQSAPAPQFARPDRPQFDARPAPQFARPDRPDRPQFDARPDPRAFDDRAARDAARQQRVDQRDAVRDQRVNQRIEQRQQVIDNRDLRQAERPVPGVMRNRVPVVSNEPRPGTMPPMRYQPRQTPQVQWNTGWRNSDRYNWQDYRRHHRSLFHFGFYYDPFGWGYQPYEIGWRLWPAYYDQRYWIDDPYEYRLPYAPPGYVWIRYWDDAILVDTWSGEVVDVIPNFFW